MSSFLRLPPTARIAATWFCCLLVACSSSSESSEVADPSQPLSFEGTFAGLQSRLFEEQGCTNSACHGTAAAGGLRLTEDVAYEQLVEVFSTASSLQRVEPGDRSRSFLYQKLLAAVEPGTIEIAGSPMPVGGEAIPAPLLEALRLWIYAGAPKEGTVLGTAELLGAALPPAEPLTILPLSPPSPEQGFQLQMPPWTVPAASEREVCFASYFDVRDQVPDERKDPSGDFAYVRAEELRQDPQSHHLILSLSKVPAEDIGHEDFGSWTCRGGESDGSDCDPLESDGCGAGHCATNPVDGFACIGYGPPVSGAGFGRTTIGGAQNAQNYQELPGGVYKLVPLRGILLWNSHAFNVTTTDHRMQGRLNFYFAEEPQYRQRRLPPKPGTLFLPSAPPYTREELCRTVELPQGAHLYSLSSHTHKRGERFEIVHPDGSLLYENLIYNDPVRRVFDPPLVFDAAEAAERTLRYCALYNNGVDSDGQPDPETVTRFSRLPASTKVPGVPGTCTPEACVSGRIGEACEGVGDDVACDSAPGAGDGYCDACPITGGESTENEMFLILGSYYLLEEDSE